MGEKDLNRQMVSIIQQHLQSLTECFDFYYSSEEDPRPGNMWIIDPFGANTEESKLCMNEKESLIVTKRKYLVTTVLKLNSNHLYQDLISGFL